MKPIFSEPNVRHETDIDARLLEWRKEKFAVEVKLERHPLEDGQVCLSVTSNGTQWTSISLLKSEVKKVIEALKAKLK